MIAVTFVQLSQLLAIGTYNGEDAFLPRIPLLPSDANLHFDLKQLQYLVKVSFAMYLNHASPRFEGNRTLLTSTLHAFPMASSMWVASHGNLFIYAAGGETRNVVYREVLQNIVHIAFHHRTSACTQ